MDESVVQFGVSGKNGRDLAVFEGLDNDAVAVVIIRTSKQLLPLLEGRGKWPVRSPQQCPVGDRSMMVAKRQCVRWPSPRERGKRSTSGRRGRAGAAGLVDWMFIRLCFMWDLVVATELGVSLQKDCTNQGRSDQQLRDKGKNVRVAAPDQVEEARGIIYEGQSSKEEDDMKPAVVDPTIFAPKQTHLHLLLTITELPFDD